MNLFLQLLAATALIALMILFRVLTQRSVIRQKLRRGSADDDCSDSECFGGCGNRATAVDTQPGPNELKL